MHCSIAYNTADHYTAHPCSFATSQSSPLYGWNGLEQLPPMHSRLSFALLMTLAKPGWTPLHISQKSRKVVEFVLQTRTDSKPVTEADIVSHGTIRV